MSKQTIEHLIVRLLSLGFNIDFTVVEEILSDPLKQVEIGKTVRNIGARLEKTTGTGYNHAANHMFNSLRDTFFLRVSPSPRMKIMNSVEIRVKTAREMQRVGQLLVRRGTKTIGKLAQEKLRWAEDIIDRVKEATCIENDEDIFALLDVAEQNLNQALNLRGDPRLETLQVQVEMERELLLIRQASVLSVQNAYDWVVTFLVRYPKQKEALALRNAWGEWLEEQDVNIIAFLVKLNATADRDQNLNYANNLLINGLEKYPFSDRLWLVGNGLDIFVRAPFFHEEAQTLAEEAQDLLSGDGPINIVLLLLERALRLDDSNQLARTLYGGLLENQKLLVPGLLEQSTQ